MPIFPINYLPQVEDEDDEFQVKKRNEELTKNELEISNKIISKRKLSPQIRDSSMFKILKSYDLNGEMPLFTRIDNMQNILKSNYNIYKPDVDVIFSDYMFRQRLYIFNKTGSAPCIEIYTFNQLNQQAFQIQEVKEGGHVNEKEEVIASRKYVKFLGQDVLSRIQKMLLETMY